MASQNNNNTSHIVRLPVEVKLEIFRLLSMSDLQSLAFTCTNFYDVIKSSEGILVNNLLLEQLSPSELAISVARYAASTPTWTGSIRMHNATPEERQDYINKVTDFCNLYLSKQATELLVPKSSFTLKMGLKILDWRISVQPLVIEIGRWWMPFGGPAATEAEIARIRKSFYILDMVTQLFPSSPVTLAQHQGEDVSQHDHAFSKFWSCFAPWESVQVKYLFRVIVSTAVDVYEKSTQRTLSHAVAGKIIMFAGVSRVASWIWNERIPGGDAIVEIFNIESVSGMFRDQPWDDTYRWFKTDIRDPEDKNYADEWEDIQTPEEEDHDLDLESEQPFSFYTVPINIQTLNRYNADIDTGARDTWLWALLRCISPAFSPALFNRTDDWVQDSLYDALW
ncbi:hypothetical protein F4779DRAFT_634330 [Xylariaceae sp. FL0662B]|nr:hypothetical protein F4779DRAFT_634330 [Xylariaceae sp. FL0662B]